jgi:cell division septal protein FtsQ
MIYQKQVDATNDYQNPRLKYAAEKRRRRFKKFFWTLAVILFVGGIVLVFFSPLFTIKNIEITGNKNVSRESLLAQIEQYEQTRFLFLVPRNNLLFFDVNAVQKSLAGNLLISSVKVEKKYPGTVLVAVNERKLNLVWLAGDQCFNLDADGKAIETCGATADEFLRIRDLKATPVALGQTAVSSEVIRFLVTSRDLLRERIAPSNYYYNFENDPKALKIETNQGFDLYLNLSLPPEEQARRLFVLLGSAEIKDKLKSLKYIDLRYGEKIYYQ